MNRWETAPVIAPPCVWSLQVLDEVDSTNTYAARLPAWSAVRAVTQSGGRGRTRDRRWVSDRGGMWLSAVVPCPGSRTTWEILPLAAGWAVIAALREIGVNSARLRWPNDVMVGRAKLAGLLVERFTNDTAVVGIGLNIANQPERDDAALAGATVRLADLVPDCGPVEDVTASILAAIGHVHSVIMQRGFSAIADELNESWRDPRRVEVTFTGNPTPVRGRFVGIDAHGRLRLLADDEISGTYDATQISLLRELE